MKPGKHNAENRETPIQHIESLPPASLDLFLTGEVGHLSNFPEKIENDRRLQEQARQRRSLHAGLAHLFKKSPDPLLGIDEMVERGLVSEGERDNIYSRLTAFLSTDENNTRLILYLPLEILPDKKNHPSFVEERFVAKYLEGFNRLLSEKDFSANFTDGHIIESADTQPSRVVQATRLIPGLVKKGLIGFEEVVAMSQSTDEVLSKSTLETIPVLHDMGLISEDEYGRFGLNRENLRKKDHVLDFEDKESFNKKFLQGVLDIDSEFEEMSGKQPDEQDRWEWERDDKKDKLRTSFAKTLAKEIIKGEVSERDLETGVDISIAIRGVRSAVVEKASENLKEANDIYQEFAPLLEACLMGNVIEKDEATTAMYYLYSLGVIDEDYLSSFGLKPKNFTDGTSNFDHGEFDVDIQTIKEDESLNSLIYPTFLFFGSRIKGYSTESADLDVGVFIKPDVWFEKRMEIEETIEKLLERHKNVGKVSQFWLEEDGDRLRVKDVPLVSIKIADPEFVNVLFGGVWAGDAFETAKIYKELLPSYLTGESEDQRKYWLRQIEREVLQYRLMHKGYSRVFPRVGGIDTEHSDLIDGKSVFLDPGFRRVASKLFISQVFLPDLN